MYADVCTFERERERDFLNKKLTKFLYYIDLLRVFLVFSEKKL